MRLFSRLGWLIICILIHSLKAPAQSADLILTNGNIFTADTTHLYVEAVAIKGNRILAAGDNQEIRKYSSRKTKVMDLHGATVVPGFNNAHDHPMFLAPAGKYFLDGSMSVSGLSREQVIDSVARLVLKAKPGEWISGPIGLTVLNDRTMRSALDSVAPLNPVYLQIWWGHGSVVNKAALNAAGIKDTDPNPSGGWYVRNPGNQINTLHENAQSSLWIAHPLSSPSVARRSLIQYGRLQLQHGMTSIQYMATAIDPTRPSFFFDELSQIQRVRLIKWASEKTYKNQRNLWNFSSEEKGRMFKISGIKYLVDGTPMEGNAFTRSSATQNGRLNYPLDTLRQIIRSALRSYDQLILHAVGDSAIKTTVAVMKELAAPDVWRKKRVRIEHNAVVAPSTQLLEDFKQLGIILMHTPKYAHSSPLKSLIDTGVVVGIAPDGSVNPFADIAQITSRQTNPAENISRENAVIAYTYVNAYAEFEEMRKGRLMPGMLADLVVLTKNIFLVPPAELADIQSDLTIVDGNIVYSTDKIK